MDFLAKPSIDPKPGQGKPCGAKVWSALACQKNRTSDFPLIPLMDSNVGCAEKTTSGASIFFSTTTTEKKKENNKIMRKNKQPYIHTAYSILVRCCDFTNDAPRLWKNTLCGTGRLTQGPKEWDVLPSVEVRWDELSIRPPEKNERLKTLNRNDGTWFISDLFLLPL